MTTQRLKYHDTVFLICSICAATDHDCHMVETGAEETSLDARAYSFASI